MNPIKHYIVKHGMTITGFANKVHLPVSTIWRYVNGKFKPCAANAIKIEKETEGELTLRELLSPTK
jgi:plasmid maintenance system antidote protein VapI